MVEEGGGAATPSPDPARTRQANEKRLKNLVENRVSNCVGVVERREAVGVSVFLASDNDREKRNQPPHDSCDFASQSDLKVGRYSPRLLGHRARIVPLFVPSRSLHPC